jgi:hypothetical protein
VQYDFITTTDELRAFCAAIPAGRAIAFDTEFVSEDNYRPDLCLLQIAAAGRLAVVDTHAVEDIRPFWEDSASARRPSACVPMCWSTSNWPRPSWGSSIPLLMAR